MIFTVFSVFFYFVANKYHSDRPAWEPRRQVGNFSIYLPMASGG